MIIATSPLSLNDAAIISDAFAAIGWQKPTEQYLRYEREQVNGVRWVRVARVDSQFAGYVTVVSISGYQPFQEAEIPEIQDLNVLPAFRRRGIATRLLDECERWIASRSKVAGIGVGLHPGYASAQRLYVRRGYIPDARGVTSSGRYVQEGESIVFDDELVLWMTKDLSLL